MTKRLEEKKLEQIIQNQSIDDISVEEIFGLFREEEELRNYLPDALCQIDPRDGALILFNSARAKRPHNDNKINLPNGTIEKSCPVCEGKTTGVVDIARLSEGYTFINKNLFPILYPHDSPEPQALRQSLYKDSNHHGRVSYGLHFLQWSSSFHDADWQNLPLEDRVIVLNRLAALERKLLNESQGLMPGSSPLNNGQRTYGFVSIIKNYGKLVGGSLKHGHQQIAFSNIMPRRFYNNWRFFKRHGAVFSQYLLNENPGELLIRDYGKAVLMVPYFMRRPYDMILVVKDTSKKHLFQLDVQEQESVAEGIHDAIKVTLHIMPQLGKDTAYNFTVNNGPGAGLYFEFLPYTQEKGGFEHLGLWICQDNPIHVVDRIKETLEEL